MSGGVPSVVRSRWAQAIMIIAPLLSLLAILAVRHRAPNGAPADLVDGAGEAFLPELRERAAEISRIEILQGDDRLTLEHRGDGDGQQWVLADRGGYPVRLERVADIVRALGALRRDQPMTELSARHGELGLAWPDPGSVATVVRLSVAGEEDPLTEIVLGRDRFSPRGQYVRLLNEDRTWRVHGAVEASATAVRYIDDRLADLPGSEVDRIEIPGGLLERDEAGEWTLSSDAPVPLTVEFDEAQRRDAEFGLPELMSHLDCDEVRADAGEAARDTIRHVTSAGTASIALIEEGEVVWMRLRWDPVDPIAVGPASDDAQASSTAKASKRSAIIDRLAPYAARWEGWLYRVPPWRTARLRSAVGWNAPPASE